MCFSKMKGTKEWQGTFTSKLKTGTHQSPHHVGTKGAPKDGMILNLKPLKGENKWREKK